jgi:hypothetical protein
MGMKQTLASATAITALAGATVALAGGTAPVLGGKAFAPHGGGFGTAHPASFFNGDDQSGYVGHIAWTHWGAAVADGVGRNPIFKPHGGYYTQLAKIDLRAEDLGACPGSTRPAYRKLEFREPKVPGGVPGPWKSWSGSGTICSFPKAR